MSIFDGMPPIDDDTFRLLSQFFNYDQNLSFITRVLSRDEQSCQIIEKIVLRGSHFHRVPGLLMIPATGSPPYPCVIMAHGLGGHKEDRAEIESDNISITKILTSAGMAILSLDAPFHGERSAEIDFLPIRSYLQPNNYRELVVDWVVEYRMALDYLGSRPEIDINRVGALGYSLGGVVVFILAALETRIKSAVTCVSLPVSQYYLSRIGWDKCNLIHMAPIAPQFFARRIVNTSFLMLNGKMDTWGKIEEIQELFDAISTSVKKFVSFDCGHLLPDEHLLLMVDWFRKYL